MSSLFRCRPTKIHINLNAVEHNLAVIRDKVKQARIMAILKADAYGHGMVTIARKLTQLGVDSFAVAFLEEGVQLRQAGIEGMILVLGGLVDYQVKHFLDYHLDLTASSLLKAEQISQEAVRLGRTARVHLKIDTGLNRIGVRSESAVDFAAKVYRLPGLEVVGIFSHFVCAQGPELHLAYQQHERFHKILETLRRQGIEFPLVHIANSSALYNLPGAIYNMVRPGITLYGYPPADYLCGEWPLKPVMSIRTSIVFLKGIRAGEGVGYMHTWQAPHDGWLVTLPVGYGDGYPRILSNRAEVLIAGKRYPVVGNISMDQAMVWLANDKVNFDEEVVLLGEQGNERIGAWELAHKAQSIPYEILCGWTPRVPRVIHDEQTSVALAPSLSGIGAMRF